MGDNTVGAIVKEVVQIIWEELQPLHMPIPTTQKLKEVAEGFNRIWNFPHVVGCLDGKHVQIKCPNRTGSMFYNYMKYFSVVLLALVDCEYKFLVIDVGGYGKQSDGGTFMSSSLYKALHDGTIVLPPSEELPGTTLRAPYVMLADEAFPLLTNLMTPYKRNTLDDSTRAFNERLSRARKTVECAFGILFSKWRILGKNIETKVDTADIIIKCLCVLQNTIIHKEGFQRHLSEVRINATSVALNQSGRLSNNAKAVRSTFKSYFEKFVVKYA